MLIKFYPRKADCVGECITAKAVTCTSACLPLGFVVWGCLVRIVPVESFLTRFPVALWKLPSGRALGSGFYKRLIPFLFKLLQYLHCHIYVLGGTLYTVRPEVTGREILSLFPTYQMMYLPANVFHLRNLSLQRWDIIAMLLFLMIFSCQPIYTNTIPSLPLNYVKQIYLIHMHEQVVYFSFV